MVYFAMLASVVTLIALLELALLGQPPKHCHYLVPVAGKPHVYSCSEHPRPVRP